MRTDIIELIQLISKEHANEESERKALRELYDEYRIPFYFTALCFFKDEKKAVAAATEAFRRIEASAYRFDEELNAEYIIPSPFDKRVCKVVAEEVGKVARKQGIARI